MNTKVGRATRFSEQLKARRRLTAAILLVLVTVISIIVVSAFGWYVQTGKPLAELPGLTKERMPHYVFSIYGATRPSSVAVNPARDRIYVVEGAGARRVIVYDPIGKQIGLLTPPHSTGVAQGPVYVAVNPITSEVYVSDRPSQSVYVYDAKGVFKETFEPKGIVVGGWQPLGMTFDDDGNFYATDVSAKPHRVLVFNSSGRLIHTVGVTDGLQFPNGVTLDALSHVYISDSNNGRVLIFDLAGKNIASINRGVGEGDLGMPRGVVIDDSDRLYVVDTANHMVKIYRVGVDKSSIPKYLGSFGDEGQIDATFEYPNGVAIDSRSRIYVTDRENNRVQIWTF